MSVSVSGEVGTLPVPAQPDSEERAALPAVAVVLAGGAGTRVGLGLPKQLLKIAGKSILEHTLEALHRSDDIDEVVVVVAAVYLDRVAHLLGDRYPKLTRLVEGGADRNESTRNAIGVLDGRECKVLFHDAVRPFIDADTLSACVTALNTFDAVDVVVETPDTIVIVDDEGKLIDIPDRRRLRRGQTPQGFLLSTIAHAYEKAQYDSEFAATDDCAVVLKYLPNVRIQTVPGTAHNLKITYPLDMFIADRLFQHNSISSPPHREERRYEEAMSGRTVVVFGGSYGIGHELMTLVREWGADAYSFSRSQTGTDVRDPDAVRDALHSVHHSTGRVDYVVNTAAVLMRGALVEMSVEGIIEQIETNLLAPALIARAALPFLQETSGQLLFFTSSSYTRGRAEYGLYSSTKAAVVNLTQALADEWSPLQVRVNCLNPERTQTPMRSRNFGDEPQDSLLSPREVAMAAVDVLLSKTTGQVVDVRRDTTARPARKPRILTGSANGAGNR